MVAAALLLACSLAARAASAKCWVQGVSFGAFPDAHRYSVADTARDFARPRGPFKMLAGGAGEPLTVVAGGAIRASFPAGEILGTNTGFSFYDDAPEPADAAWMRYRVRMSDGFQWTRGGKLPGLCGGPGDGSGRVCPVGCSAVGRDDGFSARLMWREGGAVVAYLYYPDKPRSVRCGEDFVWNGRLEPGRWHDVALRVSLNSFAADGRANADGRVEAWLDGAQALDLGGIVLRRNRAVRVSRTYLTTYVGGSSAALFAPDRDQHALFDDFASGSGRDMHACGAAPKPAAPRPPPRRRPAPAKSADCGGRPRHRDDAPRDVFGFDQHACGPGWDPPGHFARHRVPSKARTSTFARLRYCHGKCKAAGGECAGFTLYGDSCYMKGAAESARAPKFYGSGASGWRWHYRRRSSDVLSQSGADCGDLGGACCYGLAAAEGRALCGVGDCARAAGDVGGGPAPCLCSSTRCVRNRDYCPRGETCDQAFDPPPCGGRGQPCCDGLECDEPEDGGAALVCRSPPGGAAGTCLEQTPP